jgi:hypothetical protein
MSGDLERKYVQLNILMKLSNVTCVTKTGEYREA